MFAKLILYNFFFCNKYIYNLYFEAQYANVINFKYNNNMTRMSRKAIQ